MSKFKKIKAFIRRLTFMIKHGRGYKASIKQAFQFMIQEYWEEKE